MKIVISSLVFPAIICAFISELVILTIGQQFLKDGLEVGEGGILAILPGLIFFIVIIAIGGIFLYQFYKKYWGDPILIKWFYILLIFILFVGVFSLVIDFCYYLVDKDLSNSFGKFIIERNKIMGHKMTSDEKIEYLNYTFFIQNSVMNFLCIFIGALITFVLVRFFVKNGINTNKHLS